MSNSMDENRGFLGCAILKSHQIQYYYTARGEGPADPCAPTVRPCSLQTCQGGSSLPGELRRSCGSQDSSSVNETHLQVWLLISGQPPQDTFPFAPPPPRRVERESSRALCTGPAGHYQRSMGLMLPRCIFTPSVTLSPNLSEDPVTMVDSEIPLKKCHLSSLVA